MAGIEFPEPKQELGRWWVKARDGGIETHYHYPPVQGPHRYCFQTITSDPELRPAEGIELALLVSGAYYERNYYKSRNIPEWADIRAEGFSRGIRVPFTFLLTPKGHCPIDRKLAGILVEKDLKGRGLQPDRSFPADGWTEKEGVYVLGDLTFVPEDKYTNRTTMVETDGLARVVFSDRGASIAIDAVSYMGDVPYNFFPDVKQLDAPLPLVGILLGSGGSFELSGSDADYWGFCAFGVRKSDEAKAA